MTMYMRLRGGWTPGEAANPKVRKYTRRNRPDVTEETNADI
jgi:hypothetical protein